jgi:hypothetical protein
MGQSTDAIFGWGIALEEEGYDYDAAEAVEKEMKDSGVEVFSHCSGEAPMLALAINKTTAWRGSPQKINPKAPLREDAAEILMKAIKIYAEHLNGEFDEEMREKLLALTEKDFGYFICSDWN